MRHLLAYIIVLMIGSSINAQNFELLKIKKCNQISQMYEDQKGNLWFYNDIDWYESKRNALIQFDGTNWTIHRKPEGKAKPNLLNGIVENKGKMYFGTPNGILMYDGQNWENLCERESFSSGFTFFLYKDKEGTVWTNVLKNFKSAIGRIVDDEFVEFEAEGLERKDWISGAAEDDEGNIYFYRPPTLLKKYNGKEFTSLLQDKTYIDDIEFDQNGNMWLGINEGIIQVFVADSVVTYEIPGAYYNSYISAVWMPFGILPGIIMGAIVPDRASISILKNEKNNMWCVSRNHGVAVFNDIEKDFRILSEEDGITFPQKAFNVNIDREGNVWIAKGRKGVSMFDGEKWTNYSRADGLPKICQNVVQDSNGIIWVTGKKGIAKMIK